MEGECAARKAQMTLQQQNTCRITQHLKPSCKIMVPQHKYLVRILHGTFQWQQIIAPFTNSIHCDYRIEGDEASREEAQRKVQTGRWNCFCCLFVDQWDTTQLGNHVSFLDFIPCVCCDWKWLCRLCQHNFACSLDWNYAERYMYGTELVINIIYNFLPLGSMQRKLGSFGGKAFHQVYVEQFGNWLLEMTYT